MSTFAQRINCLRCTYSMFVRLCDKGGHAWMISASSERKVSGLTWSRVHRATSTWSDLQRNHKFAVPTVDCQVADERDGTSVVSDRMQENVYARNLFLNSINYARTVMQPSTTHADVTNADALNILEQDWSLMTSKETVSAIKRLSYNICYKERIDPFKYVNAFDMLNIEKLSDDDMMITIRHLVPFREHLQQYKFYQNLCVQIDKQCVKRFLQLHNEETLLLCDMLHQLMQNSQYIWYSVRKLGNKPNKLTPPQLVQILFLLNVCRKPSINMYELEYRLEECLDDLSINEIGIAALGFFKTGSRIRSTEFLSRIMEKTIIEMEAVHSVSIGAILKLIRYSMQFREIRMFLELLKALTPHEPRFTLMSLAHVAHACARVAMYDKELMDRIIGRFNSELKTARLKDMERLIFVFVTFNIDSSNSIYRNVVDELRATWNTTRAQEISKFPHVASRILGYLAVVGVYPTDLIERVMAPQYRQKMCFDNYRQLSREYCVLDCSLRLEVPEYNGPFLKPVLCRSLEKKYFQDYYESGLSDSTRANLLLSSVLETCQKLFNTSTDISVVRSLPHYALPDIVFCLDERNQLLPTESYLSQFQPGEIKRVDNDDRKNVKWIALVMAPLSLLITYTNLPTGPLAARIRHLSIVGYTPIMISDVPWNECRSVQERRDYIKKLVFGNNAPETSNT